MVHILASLRCNTAQCTLGTSDRTTGRAHTCATERRVPMIPTRRPGAVASQSRCLEWNNLAEVRKSSRAPPSATERRVPMTPTRRPGAATSHGRCLEWNTLAGARKSGHAPPFVMTTAKAEYCPLASALARGTSRLSDRRSDDSRSATDVRGAVLREMPKAAVLYINVVVAITSQLSL